ncbi:MAG: FIST C-terminal domain-containing protein [Treponema sp.]|jgi:hypothetical protein|nr:FIST C-terminal domain-containing protein [Treponema sp.]
MIKTLTASTEYIDDLDAAVKDIQDQLDREHNLLKHSAGIITCHYEFALSGAAAAIGKALPFDTLGTITSAHGTAGGAGVLRLSLMVLTSDDVRFKTALTPSLKTEPARGIKDTYDQNTAGEKKPGLILTYAPFMVENSGDEYVRVLGEVSGGAPCFGTLAVDDTPDFHNCFMLHNGEYYNDRMSLLFMYGPVKPRFFLAAISKEKVLDRSALITASEGHVLKEVNDKPVENYFEDMGLTRASETAYAMTSLPFMLDYGDGTPLVARVFIGLNENKEAICAGAMPRGAVLYMAVFDKDDVLFTTGGAIDEALAAVPGASGMLIYSCLSRSMTLAGDQFAETDIVTKKIAGGFPFMLAYSGGEICPTTISADTAVNRFHNNTCIICAFE